MLKCRENIDFFEFISKAENRLIWIQPLVWIQPFSFFRSGATDSLKKSTGYKRYK